MEVDLRRYIWSVYVKEKAGVYIVLGDNGTELYVIPASVLLGP
jgi:hypothetical protein